METVSDYKVNLIAGKSGISNIIEWFHMVENPFEIEHINEKELVFSSGMSMDTESNFMDFLEQLVARTIGSTKRKRISSCIRELFKMHFRSSKKVL